MTFILKNKSNKIINSFAVIIRTEVVCCIALRKFDTHICHKNSARVR